MKKWDEMGIWEFIEVTDIFKEKMHCKLQRETQSHVSRILCPKKTPQSLSKAYKQQLDSPLFAMPCKAKFFFFVEENSSTRNLFDAWHLCTNWQWNTREFMKDLSHLPGRHDATSAVCTAEDLCNLLIWPTRIIQTWSTKSICAIL